MNPYRHQVYRLSVSVFFFLCGCTFATWAARIPEIKDAFALNEADLGSLLFVLPFGSLVALPFAGWSVSKFGSSNMCMLGLLMYVLMLVAIAFSPTVLVLGIVLFSFGFWGDILNIAMNTQALYVQEKIYSRPLMSSFHALWSAGAFTGAAVGGWTIKADYSTFMHFIYMGTAILFSGIILWFYLSKNDLSTPGQTLFALPDRALIFLGIICFCCTMCEGSMADWSSLYYKEVVKDTSRVSTTGYTAFTFTMAAGRLIGDRLIKRFGNRKMLMIESLGITFGLGLALGFQNPYMVIAGFALTGFGVATIIPIVYSLAARNKTMSASAALAAVSTLGFTGFLVGPPIIGFVAHQTGLRIALTVVMFLGLVIFFVSRKMLRN
jgi:MFS family permease